MFMSRDRITLLICRQIISAKPFHIFSVISIRNYFFGEGLNLKPIVKMSKLGDVFE